MRHYIPNAKLEHQYTIQQKIIKKGQATDPYNYKGQFLLLPKVSQHIMYNKKNINCRALKCKIHTLKFSEDVM